MQPHQPLSRRQFMATASGVSAGAVLPGRIQARTRPSSLPGVNEKRPNIVYVFADQCRYDVLGSSGNTIIQTPNLDRFAQQGLVLDNAFSSHPLCSPYRAHLMTGRYAFKNGVVDNEYKLRDGQTTLPQALKQVGYRTAFVGKWHLGHGPYTEDRRYGFDYMAARNCEHKYFEATYHENEKGPYTIDGWGPEGETDLAIKFMEAHKRTAGDSPFALVLAWGPPHSPYNQYPKKYKLYRSGKVAVTPNVPYQLQCHTRKQLANYYANVTGLDDQMGRLMAALDRLGLADNTIVCFSSDHGDHLHCHGYGGPGDMWLHRTKRANKATPYEESIHVPFILRFPRRVQAGGRTSAMFSSVDVMPTLLGLCGAKIPDSVQGYDLSHIVTGQPGPDAPDSVYLMNMGPGWPCRDNGQWVGHWRGVRTARWVYARWHDDPDQGPLLFDRKDDPYEMKNLAGRKEYADVQQQMEARLKQWMRQTEDPFETGRRDPETGMLLLGQEFANRRLHEKRCRAKGKALPR